MIEPQADAGGRLGAHGGELVVRGRSSRSGGTSRTRDRPRHAEIGCPPTVFDVTRDARGAGALGLARVAAAQQHVGGCVSRSLPSGSWHRSQRTAATSLPGVVALRALEIDARMMRCHVAGDSVRSHAGEVPADHSATVTTADAERPQRTGRLRGGNT